MVLGARRASNVICLTDRRICQELVLFQIISDQFRPVPVETILTKSSFTPPAAENQATYIASFLGTVPTLMLAAVETHCATGPSLGARVHAIIVIRTWAARAENQISSIPANLAVLQ